MIIHLSPDPDMVAQQRIVAFSTLSPPDLFMMANGKGAIYMKVLDRHTGGVGNTYAYVELSSGHHFPVRDNYDPNVIKVASGPVNATL